MAEIDGAEDVPGDENGTIVWSPFSNLWLYRATTHVESARSEGMRICLGSDWSPSGSKNLLGELKVADLWNRTQMGNAFSAEALCAMATRNPAEAIGWSDLIGRLKEDLHADVLVTNRSQSRRRSTNEQSARSATVPEVVYHPHSGEARPRDR